MTTKPISQILSDAADLIEKPGAWIQGAACTDVDGINEDPQKAVRFCMFGAICRVTGETHITSEVSILFRDLGVERIPAWNDDKSRTQPEVVAMLRKAAEKAKGEGGEESKL